MDDEKINALAHTLITSGSAVSTDEENRKLMLVLSTVLAFADQRRLSILVAYEGQGAFFWSVDEKLSPFRLIEAGFSLRLAPTLADILNRVGRKIVDRAGTSLPMLEAPRGTEGKE